MKAFTQKKWKYISGMILVASLLGDSVLGQVVSPQPLASKPSKKMPTTLQEVIAAAPFHFPPEAIKRMEAINESASTAQAGDALAAHGNWTQAIASYQQALALWPSNQIALYGLGDYSLTKNDTQAAIGYYRQAIYDYATPPTMPRFQEINAYRLMEYAILLSQTGQQDEAIAAYQRGAQLLNYIDGHPRPKPMLPDFGTEPGQIAYTPQHLQALADVGWANDHVDFDREGAKARLQQAVALYPDSPLPYFYRARYEANYGHDRNAAATDFAKVDQLGSGATLEFVDHDRHFYHLETAPPKPPVAQKRSATP